MVEIIISILALTCLVASSFTKGTLEIVLLVLWGVLFTATLVIPVIKKKRIK